jgi:sugar phosphate isomerase/epimerase
MDDLKFVELCAQLELDGVDFNLRSFHSQEQEHLKKIKKKCLERGLSIACLGVSNDFGRPADEQEAIRKQVRQGIDTAQFLGAPEVRLFAGSLKAGQRRDVVWKRAVEGLRQSAEYGEKVGVVVGLQNHNHNNIAATADDVARLLEDVNHPWCQHILDTGQYLGSPGAAGARPEDSRQHDVYKSIARTAQLAVFVRAKLYRLKDGKEEWLDYERIFKILGEVKYNGFVSLVYEGWQHMDAMHAVPLGVKFLRGFMARQGGLSKKPLARAFDRGQARQDDIGTAIEDIVDLFGRIKHVSAGRSARSLRSFRLPPAPENSFRSVRRRFKRRGVLMDQHSPALAVVAPQLGRRPSVGLAK